MDWNGMEWIGMIRNSEITEEITFFYSSIAIQETIFYRVTGF